MRLYLLAGLLLGALASLAPAQDHVWIEGESPTAADAPFEATGPGHADYLSGGKWLFAGVEAKDLEAKVPAGGAVLSYPFEAKAAGDHEVWARVGYEFARTPFSWRLDGGAWAEVAPGELTTDLMALAPAAEVAWLKLGKAPLTAGEHTFQVKIERKYRTKDGNKEPERVLFALDCVRLCRGEFRPNGAHQPGANWQTEDDRRAARHVFEVKSGGTDGERALTRLEGQWQVARWDENELKDRPEPVKELPADLGAMFWKAIAVPGDRDANRPELAYAHRYLYRTRIQVPAEFAGRSFVLRFPSTALLASVFVNGKYCGGSKAPLALWECDATAAVKPGEVNEIVVAVKDAYYGIARDLEGRSARYLFNVPHDTLFSAGVKGPLWYADFPIAFHLLGNGLLETPSVVVTGPAYAADVFVKPSVRKKQLGTELTFHNPTGRAIEASVALAVVALGKDGQTPEGDPILFPATALRLGAGETKTVERAEYWVAPKLWWPDDPVQYQLITTLKADGRVLDIQRTKFGFREWEWKGQHFTLNGVPWHLRADLDEPSKDPDDAVKIWKERGQNMVRYMGDRPWFGHTQEQTLDHFDRLGMPVRRSGIFDGMAGSYMLLDDKGGPRRELFDNWITQLRAWVKAERNHPSIFIWAIENEIIFINARNLGWLKPVEPEVRRAAETVMALDPTRPAMIDGGDALSDASLPIYGNHYPETSLREYPDEAYTLRAAFARQKDPKRWAPWPLGDDRPMLIGETFAPGTASPSEMALLQGEEAFSGWNAARPGVGLATKMLVEGYRWHGVAGFHLYLGTERTDAHYHSFQPLCVLCREWNWTFAGGQEVRRTLKVFNDTRFDSPIEVRTRQTLGGKVIGETARTFRVAPGTATDYSYSFPLPQVSERADGELVLTCERDGKEVFREVKPLRVLPASPPAAPDLTAAELAVWDPSGIVKARLRQRGVAFAEVDQFEAIPAVAKVVVVGPNAVSPGEAADPKWQKLTSGGKRVLVLDQAHPLRGDALAAALEPTDRGGRVAFSEDLAHPAFAGLTQPDFFCWSGNHVVYRNAYKRPSRGARSLAECDEELACSALAECRAKDGGLLVLCQMLAGSKLGSNPVAQRLFDNLLNYCATYRVPKPKVTSVVLPSGDPRLKLLDAAGLTYWEEIDLRSALANPANEIVVADASPANLKVLSGLPEAVKAFTGRGGWLMLWGVTPDGLADFNKVVGQDHALRPFRQERVMLAAVRDPLAAGLTEADVKLLSKDRLSPWAREMAPADDTLSYVVDLDNIAPFTSSVPPGKYMWVWDKMTDGFTSADSWSFVVYQSLGDEPDPPPQWCGEFPREVEVTEFGIVVNTHYNTITKMRLVFDGRDDDAVTLDLKPVAELRQEFVISPPRKCRSIRLEPVAWTKTGKGETIGVDEAWIKVRRSEDYYKTVVPLLNIGGLVKYRMGPGGVLLNQVLVKEDEANPDNAEKKRAIVATLLRNLGAQFTGEHGPAPRAASLGPAAGASPPAGGALLVVVLLAVLALLVLLLVVAKVRISRGG